MKPIFSCIIPAKSDKVPRLQKLIESIKAQTIAHRIEILVETKGNPESAKAMAIARSQGKYLCMLCDDNLFVDNEIFEKVLTLFQTFPRVTGIYSRHYSLNCENNSLNRYFALMGCNDPVAFYLDKCDRKSYLDGFSDQVFEMVNFTRDVPTLGENGFFYRKEILLLSDMQNYSHIDNAYDLIVKGYNQFIILNEDYVAHNTTDGDLVGFLKRRYRYARDLYCESKNRRWRMVSGKGDILRLALYVLFTLSIIQPLSVSIRGFNKIRERAWFWHTPVCLGFLVMYTILAVKQCLKSLSSSRH
jgi:glycosyltransferase involved in cell wall biosynthesis